MASPETDHCALRGISTSPPAGHFSTPSSPSPPTPPSPATRPPSSSPQQRSPARGAPLNPSYLGTHLKEDEERSFKAAGIMPIAFFTSPPPGGLVGPPKAAKQAEAKPGDESEDEDGGGGADEKSGTAPRAAATKDGVPVPYVLLGCETRRKQVKTDEVYINLFGGKREACDSSAAETAWREFWEETGRLLPDQAQPFLDHCRDGADRRRVLWFSPGKYVLFLYHLPYPAPEWTTKLAEQYRQLESREEGSEMDSLHWVSLPALLEAVGRRAPEDRAVYGADDGKPYPVFRFSADIVAHLSRYFESVIKGQTHAVPPLDSTTSPSRRSPYRAPHGSPHGSSGTAGGQPPSRSYHTTPPSPTGKHQRSPHTTKPATPATGSAPATGAAPLSARAKPFYPKSACPAQLGGARPKDKV